MRVARHPGSFGVSSRPDRSVRIQPESFTQDPGMRARDEFTDITSRGYNEWATRAAENPQQQYATSVEEEEARRSAEQKREWAARLLAALMGGRAMGSGMQRMFTNPRFTGAVMPHHVGPVGPGQFMAYQRGGEQVNRVLGGLGGAFAAGVGPLTDALDRLKQRKGWPPYDNPEFQGANWGRP